MPGGDHENSKIPGCNWQVKRAIRLLLIAGVAVSTVQSKESEQDQGLQSKLMLVALGPMPPRRYSEDTKRGDAAMLLPMEGEVPPNQLYYRVSDNAREASGKWMPFPLAFNNTTAMKSVKAGVELILHRKLADGYEPYVTIPELEVGMRHVVFLTPSSKGKSKHRPWFHGPQVTLVSPDSAGLTGKQFMIKNLSGKKVLHAFGESIASIEPGDLLAYRRSQSGVLYRLAARYGDKRHIIYNMAVRIDEESGAHLYALYDARAETNAGRSVGVFRMVVPVPGS